MGASALAIAGAGFSLGRYVAPPRVETRGRIVERQGKAQEDRTAEKAAESVAHVVGTKYVIRVIEKPDGTKERRESWEKKQQDTKVKEVEKVVTKTVVEYRDRVVEKERVVVRDSRPGWAATGAIGTGLDRRPFGTAGVEKRLVGPVWVGGWVGTNKTAGFSARWEF